MSLLVLASVVRIIQLDQSLKVEGGIRPTSTNTPPFQQMNGRYRIN